MCTFDIFTNMMYSFHNCLFLVATKVNYFSVAFPDVGLNITIYRVCNDITLCDGEFYQNSLIPTSIKTTKIISASVLLNATFSNIMKKSKDQLPSFVNVKRHLTLMFSKDDVGNYVLTLISLLECSILIHHVKTINIVVLFS